ncbi:unnamed protein product [Scytosiphon promiscuus]
MIPRVLPVFMASACFPPAGSFVFQPTASGGLQRQSQSCVRGAPQPTRIPDPNPAERFGRGGHAAHLYRYLSQAVVASPRSISTNLAVRASAEGTTAPTTRLFNSSEAVSHLRNPEQDSDIWLVGLCHRSEPSVELVENVIREIKPQVVMVELDAYRIRLLPPGEALKGGDGLCWWRPNHRPVELDAPKRSKKDAKRKFEQGEQGVEFYAAAIEAQACGAQLLLGDRDFEEIMRRQSEAKEADKKTAAKPSDKRRRAGLDMDKLEGLIARRSALGQEVPVTREIMRKWSAAMKRLRPQEHIANVTERDQVMAENLVKLESGQVTVAVVGFGHLDGIEDILGANGWRQVER